ncbi:MAG: response regulator [Bacteroides sp.]|nr:response regulator [Bacteroides sp.]
MQTGKFILILCMFFIVLPRISAENTTRHWAERYNITYLTIDDGLPHNAVEDIVKDSRGFLWIATSSEGIARYDGQEFIPFNMGTARAKLRSNFIHKMCEDRFDRLWVASEVGLDIIDLKRLANTQIPDEDNRFASFCNQPVNHLWQSSEGNIWVCSENKLFKVTFHEDGSIAHIIQVWQLPESKSIRTICEVDDYLWMNYKDGVYRIKESTLKEQEPSFISSALQLPDVDINVIRKKENDIWIGCMQGLFRYNIGTERIKHYGHEERDPNSLSQNWVTDISVTASHSLLVATFKGLNVYNPILDSFERVNRDNGENTLNNDFINCLMADGDIIWAGTAIGGLNKIGKRTLYLQNYSHSNEWAGSLSKNPVNAIYEDPTGGLWVGTVEGGLNYKQPESNTFVHYTTDAPARLSHNSVSCFTVDDCNRLWIGTWGGGFGWMEMKGCNRTFHHIEDSRFADASRGFVGAICYDPLNQAIWVGTSNSLYTYDLKTHTVAEPFRKKQLGGIDGCTGYYLEDDTYLWIGLTKGLCRIDLRTWGTPEPSYRLWSYKLDNPESKLVERVTYIIQATDGTFWIGSNGYGFYQATKQDNGEYVFKGYTTEDGLISNSVRALQEDKEGRIWITTTNGLSCYDPASDIFYNYTQKDGLLSNQFYWNAIGKSANGKIYLGSTEGLTVIQPFIDIKEQESAPLAFTHLHVAEQEKLVEEGRIELHERDKYLSIEFAALDYDSPDFAVYSYRLKGFDDKWVKVPANQRIATFTNLHPGNYTFELRYAPDGRQWQEQTAVLDIYVAPYFYKTYWFVILVILVLSFLIYRIVAWRIHSFQEQRRLLHIKVEERTRELQEQKQVLATQAGELYSQNELLKQQNDKILKQQAQLIEMSNKVQELTIDKLAFFTNITHEFRTPLTLIVGPIERALKLSYNPQVIEQLHFVERNSKYLLSLVNQLMDFRKIESGKMNISPNPNNFKKFLREFLLPFEGYTNEHQITLKLCIDLPEQSTMYDEDAMQKVLTNLMGNAVKFTPSGGQITLYATTLRRNGEEMLYLCVQDNGPGIPEEDLDKIFNRFYQAKNQVSTSVSGQSGTGIGLYLCQQIILLHKGEICARNNPTRGSSFRVLLPWTSVEGTAESKKEEISVEEQQETLQLSSENSRLTILVVEDNADMRGYIRSILEEYYNVVEATQGKEALDILAVQNIDFIISDLMMPVMDGMELSKRVKANFNISHIPFLMLTAKTSNEARIESFRIGVDEYLLKPFDDTLLLARIANILENRKRFQQKFSFNMDIEELNVEEESNDKKFLNKAMQIVKENYKDSEYEVSDFVEAMGVSKSLMNKKMKNLTGQSAGQFIRNYRLNIARELILKNKVTHNKNISEIAYEVGFNDPKYFTRCFTRHFNQTPSALLGADED